MPELPEVETVRRALEAHVLGRSIAAARISGARLRGSVPRGLPGRLRGRRIEGIRRHGKYLLFDLSGDVSLLSHLGMSGRWLFYAGTPPAGMTHVHAVIRFADGGTLLFQDPRRFGLLKAGSAGRIRTDPALAILGADPVATPPTGETLAALGRDTRLSVKNFLLDQRRVAGIGNIYASEILHRARVDPRRRAGSLSPPEWEAVAAETTRVLGEAIERMGTTFSMYRTPWNEPGGYAERLLVYDRAGEPCRRCRTPIRRIVQGQRSTYFCPSCQPRRPARASGPVARRSGRAPRGAGSGRASARSTALKASIRGL